MKGQDNVIITMPELMEQMDVSDKTIHRLIDDGQLPDFTYGSRHAKKKGWHAAVLERHAMARYERSQSIQNARHIGQIGAEDMGIPIFRGRHRGVS
jgi:transcriptional antiterminator